MDIDTNGRGIAQIDDDDEADHTCQRCDCEYTMDVGDEPTPFCDRCAHAEVAEQADTIATLRTTLARLTADLAAVTSDRDMWRSECESISAELDLPPGMRPMEGELRRMLGHNRALLAERDEARGLLDAADTTRREWEVRAATSYAAGRAAGLREAAALLERASEAFRPSKGCDLVRDMGVAVLALAAEPRDEWEVSDE